MKKSYVIGLICLGFLGVAYNNCSKVSVDTVADGSGTVGAVTVDEAITNCIEAREKGAILISDQTLNFPDTRNQTPGGAPVAKVCKFKPGASTDNTPDPVTGNLTMKNDFLRARYEQEKELVIPANAVICGMEVKANKQQFYYDDIFYFALNDVVLASSLKSSLENTTKNDFSYKGKTIPLYDYNWSKFANSNFCHLSTACNDPAEKAKYTLGPDDYCVGSEAGAGDCKWPETQQNGYIELGFDPEVVIPISLGNKSEKNKVKLVVTGDNDETVDCYHESIDLNVRLSYYVK